MGFVPEQFHAAEGRNVVVQIADGEYRPAQIVKCWGQPDDPHVAVNLVVFLDGSNDNRYDLAAAGVYRDAAARCVAWATSRVQGPAVGQWLARRPH